MSHSAVSDPIQASSIKTSANGASGKGPHQRINKVAVLGAGTMGARIAAHFANAGIPAFCWILFRLTPLRALTKLPATRS